MKYIPSNADDLLLDNEKRSELLKKISFERKTLYRVLGYRVHFGYEMKEGVSSPEEFVRDFGLNSDELKSIFHETMIKNMESFLFYKQEVLEEDGSDFDLDGYFFGLLEVEEQLLLALIYLKAEDLVYYTNFYTVHQRMMIREYMNYKKKKPHFAQINL